MFRCKDDVSSQLSAESGTLEARSLFQTDPAVAVISARQTRTNTVGVGQLGYLQGETSGAQV